jgi:DNA-directed RNA polymerase subunit RPC12/RpoP
MATQIFCVDCGQPRLADGVPYRCQSCGRRFTMKDQWKHAQRMDQWRGHRSSVPATGCPNCKQDVPIMTNGTITEHTVLVSEAIGVKRCSGSGRNVREYG